MRGHTMLEAPGGPGRTAGQLRAVVVISLALAVPACVLDDIDLAGRPCPCVAPFVCDPATRTCVRDLADAGAGEGGAVDGGGDGAVPDGGGDGAVPDGGGDTAASVFEAVPLRPGGSAQAIAVAPPPSPRLYSLFDPDRLYRSDDQGASWAACARPAAGDGVATLAASPTDADSAYAGVDGDLLHTSDGCRSWQSTGLGRTATQVVVLPGGDIVAGTYSGLWRRTGSTWQSQTSVLDGYAIRSLVADASGQLLLAGSAGNGIARSDDGGTSWGAANSGLTTSDIYSVALDALDPQHAVAGGGDGVFRSDDGGVSWTPVSSQWCNYVAIDPTDGSYVLASTPNDLMASTDGGASFEEWTDCRTAAMNRGLVSQVVFVPDQNHRVYAASDRGLFATSGRSCDWTEIDAGIDAWYLNAIATAPTAGDVFLATSSGVVTSYDGWAVHTAGYAFYSWTRAVSFDLDDEGVLYAAAAHQVRVSRDGAQSFESTGAGEYWGFSVCRARGPRIYAGMDLGLRVSTDGGATWTTRQVAGVDRRVRDLVVLDWTASAMVVATDTGVFYSPDEGASWSGFNTDLAERDAYALERLPDDTLLVGTAAGVYAAADPQSPWVALGPPECQVRDLLTRGSTVVAACDGAVVYSLDAGSHWSALPGLEGMWPRALGVDADGRLLVGTGGYGLHRTAFPGP